MPIKGDMEEALKERIRRDDPANFDPDGWKTARLGFTYDENDEWIDAAVLETTEDVVKKRGRYLPDRVWRALIDEVGVNTKASEAIDSMVNAALRARPRPANDEGPIVGRPRTRPTLKRRDEK